MAVETEDVQYWRVAYHGGIAIRDDPEKPAGPDAPSFERNEILRCLPGEKKIEGGVLVHLLRGGWAFKSKGNLEVLEPVSPPKSVTGFWAYRVTAPNGMRFAPTSDFAAATAGAGTPSRLTLVGAGDVVTARRKLCPSGGGPVAVQLDDGLGWLFESQQDGELLDSLDGACPVEKVSPALREEGPFWYGVVHTSGAVLLEGPDTEGPDLLEMFLFRKLFEASERYRPPGEETVYLKLAGRPGWVVQRYEGTEMCAEEEPPADELLYNSWWRVVYPGGVRVRLRPELLGGMTGQVLLCGQFFRAIRRVKGPGDDQVSFLLVDARGLGGGGGGGRWDGSGGDAWEGAANAATLLNGAAAGAAAAAAAAAARLPPDSVGWVPVNRRDLEVVAPVEEPRVARGLFAYQVVVEESLPARVGPHDLAPEMAQELPPFSVAAVTQVVETADGAEGYVELRDSRGWVRFRHGDDDVRMERLPGFPRVDKAPRDFVVVAEAGAPARVGPSAAAATTGEVLQCGERVTAAMSWVVPPVSGKGEPSAFLLIRGKGWVVAGTGEGPVLEEIVTESPLA
ncbi:unnamed protein product [Phaeothamnion confervicola]